MPDDLKAPFPAFGGKSRVAALVWKHFGQVTNYVEPFFNSGAVLLARPSPFGGAETANDVDCYIANFWRSVRSAPEQVAEHADWPVSEVDLHARHRYLVLGEGAERFRERMRADPEFYDARFAGWWCWGLCCWIGSGWCAADQLERHAGQLPPLTKVHGDGIMRKRPRVPRENDDQAGPTALPGVLGSPGSADWSKRPELQGRGVTGRPQLADAYDIGRGVNASPPAGACAERRAWLLDWFGRLADRLRNVRVCCGDWARVCSSPSVLTILGTTAVFLDPPYPTRREGRKKSRSGNLYASDAAGADALDTLRDDVLAWCRKWGPDRGMRIAVCGYDGDGYEALVAEGWRERAWKTSGGYGKHTEQGKENATRERIWFSPNCNYERTLFDSLEG